MPEPTTGTTTTPRTPPQPRPGRRHRTATAAAAAAAAATTATTTAAVEPPPPPPPTPTTARASTTPHLATWRTHLGLEQSVEEQAEALARRLQYATDILLDKLFAYLSQLPEEPNEDDDGNDTDNDNGGDGGGRGIGGMTLPAAAIGWLSSQLYPPSFSSGAVATGEDEDEDVNANANGEHGGGTPYLPPTVWCSVQLRDRLRLLQFLLPRVTHLRITRSVWPPELPSQERQEAAAARLLLSSRRHRHTTTPTTNVSPLPPPPPVSHPIDELNCSINSVSSGLTLDELPYHYGHLHVPHVPHQHQAGNHPPPTSSLLSASQWRRAFWEYYTYDLQQRPRLDLRVFPRVQVLVLESIPPTWVHHLTCLRPTLQVLKWNRACLYHTLPTLLLGRVRSPTNTMTMTITVGADTNPLPTEQSPSRPKSSSSSDMVVTKEYKNKYNNNNNSNNYDCDHLVYTKLTHLHLHHCGIGEWSGLSHTLRRCAPHLRKVSLANNDLIHPRSALRGLQPSSPHLEKIDLRHNQLTSLHNAHLWLGGQLRCLVLSYNALVTTHHGLDRLYGLTELWLDHNRIMDLSELSGLTRLTQLDALYLQGNPVLYNQPLPPTTTTTTYSSRRGLRGRQQRRRQHSSLVSSSKDDDSEAMALFTLWCWFRDARQATSALELPTLNGRRITTDEWNRLHHPHDLCRTTVLLRIEPRPPQKANEGKKNGDPLTTTATTFTTTATSLPLRFQKVQRRGRRHYHHHHHHQISTRNGRRRQVAVVSEQVSSGRGFGADDKRRAICRWSRSSGRSRLPQIRRRRRHQHHHHQTSPNKTIESSLSSSSSSSSVPTAITSTCRSVSFSVQDVLVQLHHDGEGSSKNRQTPHNEDQDVPDVVEEEVDLVLPEEEEENGDDGAGEEPALHLIQTLFFGGADECEHSSSSLQVTPESSQMMVLTQPHDPASPPQTTSKVLNKMRRLGGADESTMTPLASNMGGGGKKIATLALQSGAAPGRSLDIVHLEWDTLVQLGLEGLIPDGKPRMRIPELAMPSNPLSQDRGGRVGGGAGLSFSLDATNFLSPTLANSTHLAETRQRKSAPGLMAPTVLDNQSSSSIMGSRSATLLLPEQIYSDDCSVLSSLGTNDFSNHHNNSKSKNSNNNNNNTNNEFQLAESNAVYDGPEPWSHMNVLDNMELYFDTYVFPSKDDGDDDDDDFDDWQLVALRYPRIQLWPDDRRRQNTMAAQQHQLTSPSSSRELLLTLTRERCIRVWEEQVIPCGKSALQRLQPHRRQRLGFHGDQLYTGGTPDPYSESRTVYLCLSSAAFYILVQQDTVTKKQDERGIKKHFPNPIPATATFDDAPWPHAIARHGFSELEAITIGFEFQRLTLHFRTPSIRKKDPFVYVLLMSNKTETVKVLQDLQRLAKEAHTTMELGSETGVGGTSVVAIENDSQLVFDALQVAVAPDVVGTIFHYQIVQQRWKSGVQQRWNIGEGRGAVRRVCVVTETKIWLLDEDYHSDGHESRVEPPSFPPRARGRPATTMAFGSVSYRMVDEATLAQVSEVQAAGADPKAITLVIQPLSRLSRTHRWRLVCRDSAGAERLVDMVRKAMTFGEDM